MDANQLLNTCHSVLPENAPLKNVNVLHFRDRVLVSKPEARKLLRHFVTAKTTLTKVKWTRLLNMLDAAPRSVPLANMLRAMLEDQTNAGTLVQFHFAGIWTNLLKVLGSHTSIVDLIRRDGWHIAELLSTQPGYVLTPEQCHTLLRAAPLIYGVYAHKKSWPAYGCDLLGSILKVCKARMNFHVSSIRMHLETYL